MEIYLAVDLNTDGSFLVYRSLDKPYRGLISVLVIDYNYRPWPRRGGNLLW